MQNKIINVIEIQWEDNHRGISTKTLNWIAEEIGEGEIGGEITRIIWSKNKDNHRIDDTIVKGHWHYTVMIEEDQE